MSPIWRLRRFGIWGSSFSTVPDGRRSSVGFAKPRLSCSLWRGPHFFELWFKRREPSVPLLDGEREPSGGSWRRCPHGPWTRLFLTEFREIDLFRDPYMPTTGAERAQEFQGNQHLTTYVFSCSTDLRSRAQSPKRPSTFTILAITWTLGEKQTIAVEDRASSMPLVVASPSTRAAWLARSEIGSPSSASRHTVAVPVSQSV